MPLLQFELERLARSDEQHCCSEDNPIETGLIDGKGWGDGWLSDGKGYNQYHKMNHAWNEVGDEDGYGEGCGRAVGGLRTKPTSTALAPANFIRY